MRPTVEHVAGSFEQTVRFREVNSARDPGLAASHSIKGVPTLVALHDGKEVRRVVGVQSDQRISDVFDAAASGVGARGSLAPHDRILRLSIALVLGIAAALSGQPVLWALAAGAAASALWDLIRS